MVQEPRQDQPEEDSDEGNQVDDSGANTGCSKYARGGKDSDVASWLKSKEEKRTKATSQGLSRRVGLSSRKGLNPVSKKQKKKNSGYKEAMASHYAEEKNQKCFLCGRTDGLSIHHKKKRGKYLDDEFYFMTLCIIGDTFSKEHPELNPGTGCHGVVEANKSWAREKGYLL